MPEHLALTDELLASLLSDAEHQRLDFKRELDLSAGKDAVEIVKDIGAFAMHGGHIVIGVNDNGQPSGHFTAARAALFDEARLRGKVAKYLDGVIVRTKIFDLETGPVALVSIEPHEDGWAVFSADGTWADERGRQKTAFRAGEVFARHNTSSERWNQADVRRRRTELAAAERESARVELRSLFETAAQLGSAARGVAASPIGALSLDLDTELLTNAVLELLRGGDLIPLKVLFTEIPSSALAAAKGAPGELDGILDRVVALAATFSLAEDLKHAEKTIEAMAEIYNGSTDANGIDRQDLAISATDLQFRIITRAYALGAEFVRRKQWSLVRKIATIKPATHDNDWFTNWLVHADVWAARNGLHDHEVNGRRLYRPTLLYAQEHAARIPALRLGLTADDPRIIESLTQFSALASLAAIDAGESRNDDPFLPQFAPFHSRDSDPAFAAVVNDKDARAQIFRGDDPALAAALRLIARQAPKFGTNYFGWDGYGDPRVLDFLDTHLEQSPSP